MAELLSDKILQLPPEIILRIFDLLPFKLITPFVQIDRTRRIAIQRIFSHIELTAVGKGKSHSLGDSENILTLEQLYQSFDKYSDDLHPTSLSIVGLEVAQIKELVVKVGARVTTIPRVSISLVCDAIEDLSYFSFVKDFDNIEAISLIHGTADHFDEVSSSLQRLKKLQLLCCGLSGFDCIDFNPLASLRELDLTGNRIDPNWLLNLPETLKMLDLSENEIDFNDSDLFLELPASMEVLTLSGNRMSDPSVLHLQSMTKLRKLDISNCKISNLPVNLCEVLPPFLEELDLSNNIATTFNVKVFPRCLTRLDIRYNSFQKLENIRFPTSLKILDMDGRKTTSLDLNSLILPDTMERLSIENMSRSTVHQYKFPTNLQSLRLISCGVTSLEDLHFPNGLEELHLTKNKIGVIKDYDFPCSLKELFLDDNSIRILDNVSFDQGKKSPADNSLVTLFLNKNQIDNLNGIKLPDTLLVLQCEDNEISSLKGVVFPNGLEYLQLDDNKITSVKNIKFPDGLKFIGITRNGLTDFYSSGEDLPPRLEGIIVTQNQIGDIDPGYKFPDSLLRLSFYANNVSNLHQLTYPQNLISLNVSYNPVTNYESFRFPEKLEVFTSFCIGAESLDLWNFPKSLKRLRVAANPIKKIGSNIGSLENLIILHAYMCEIESIEDLELPDSLKELNIADNKIREIDVNLLPAGLTHLNVAGNPIDADTRKQIQIEAKLRSLEVEFDVNME